MSEDAKITAPTQGTPSTQDTPSPLLPLPRWVLREVTQLTESHANAICDELRAAEASRDQAIICLESAQHQVTQLRLTLDRHSKLLRELQAYAPTRL